MGVECFLCKNPRVNFLLEKDGYDLWSCGKCGLNFVYPQPTDKELQKFYSLKSGYSHSSKGFDLDSVSEDYEKRIDFLVENNARKVLDVGCASGSFVHHAKRRGMVAVGVDLDKDSIKFGTQNGLDLRHGKLGDMKFRKGEFDAVNLGDIMEHVKDPEGFLKECLRVLKKGGVLVVSTPNTNSMFPKVTRWVYEKMGIMWSHPTPPYHLFDFSDENLRQVLERNGVEVLGIDYKKIPLSYVIYHTGYFDRLRKKIKGTSKKGIFIGFLKSLDFCIFRQLWVAFVYWCIFCADRLVENKGDHMFIYSIRK